MIEIKKVSKHKNGSKVLIIPRKSKIEAGDYVKIEKINFENSEENFENDQ